MFGGKIVLRRFLEQAWLYYKGQNAGFHMEEFILMKISIPILSLIMYCIMAAYGFKTNSLEYWVIGNSFLLCTSTCVFSLGMSFTGERYYGRLRSIIAAPRSKFLLVLEKGFFPMLEALVSVLAGFLVGSLLFKVDFSQINFGLYFIIILAAMFCASGFGMILGIFGMLTSEIHLFLNSTSLLLVIFTGANFPITMLPPAVRWISDCIPLTRSMRAGNLLFTGETTDVILNLILSEFLLGVFYFVLSQVILKMVERRAIRKASFDVF